MIVEVIAVGTELLLGEIVNTNAADIGLRLAEDGFDIHHQVTIGDNLGRLVNAIRTASDRADAVILTGGIGPTQDDQTRDALCVLLGVDVVTDEGHAEAIRARLAERGVVADSALRMANYPEGSDPLPNRNGVALGIAATYQGTPIFAVPGVPSEMRAMIDEQVRPRLRSASGEPAVLSSRLLHCWGLGESQIAEQLDDLYESVNPSVAFLINGPEVRVRITAKGVDQAEATALIDAVDSVVRQRLGDVVFATDETTVDAMVGEQLIKHGWSIGTHESCTRGLFAARLAALDSFSGGSVVQEVRSEVNDVEAHTEEVLNALSHGLSDVVVVVGEMAGSSAAGGTSGRQIGIAIRTPDRIMVTSLRVLGDEDRGRTFAVSGAMHLLRQVLSA